MTETARVAPMDPYEFCQEYTDAKGKVVPNGRYRCVAGRGHIGKHDPQPLRSLTVQQIERRELELERLGYPKPGTTPVVPAVLGAIDKELAPRPVEDTPLPENS